MKVALLEDDDAQADLVMSWLQTLGHEAERSSTCATFLERFDRTMPQFAILDWELPDGTGMEVLTHLRKRDVDMPVLFVTQRDSEEDIVTALSTGADDYLAKPLRQKEFVARVHALGRRIKAFPLHQTLVLGDFKIDKNLQTIYRAEQHIPLTQKDYELAVCFFENHGKALSRDYLLKEVWGIDSDIDTRTVDMHVSRLRRSLGIGPENGFMIKTIYRFGYRLEKIG